MEISKNFPRGFMLFIPAWPLDFHALDKFSVFQLRRGILTLMEEISSWSVYPSMVILDLFSIHGRYFHLREESCKFGIFLDPLLLAPLSSLGARMAWWWNFHFPRFPRTLPFSALLSPWAPFAHWEGISLGANLLCSQNFNISTLSLDTLF